MPFIIPSRTSSYADIYEAAVAYVMQKPDYEKFKDHYTSSLGTTMLELDAGFSEFRTTEVRLARRESYLPEAKLRTSCIGIAQTLGYSAHRGTNVHLQLTFTPMQDATIVPFDIVGSVAEYDLVALEEKSVRYGVNETLKVGIGKLKTEEVTIQGSKYFVFRFITPKVSEDLLVTLNGVEVPTSRDILKLDQDYWLVMSNAVDSVDIWYLNRFPPSYWNASFRYSFTDYINPRYDWRRNFKYSVGQVCTAVGDMSTFYKCVRAGQTSINEPTWLPEKGKFTTDGTVMWESIGSLRRNIFFKSVTPGVGYTGSVEPVWPIEVGTRVQDGDIEWMATDIYSTSKWPYTAGDVLKITYIELENINYDEGDIDLFLGNIQVIQRMKDFQDREDMDSIKLNAPLYHETKAVVKGREDYRKMFREITPDIVDGNGYDITPAVVQLSYVKNHTTTKWEPNIIFNKDDEILPAHPNNFIYRATNTGRSGLSTQGASGASEPDWQNLMDQGSTFTDGQITWEIQPLITSPPYWAAETVYKRGDIVRGKVNNGCQYEAVAFNPEPTWPTEIGKTVVDNEVTWECYDTIFLGGYEADYRRPDTAYNVGDFVEPVTETGYYYRCTVAGTTATEDPGDWPTTVCETILDGTCVFECYDSIYSDKYVKNNTLRALAANRPYGVEPPTMIDPILVYVHLNIYLEMTLIKDLTSVNNDIDALLAKYERKLGQQLKTYDLENEIEQSLSYVTIARVEATRETKSTTWAPGVKHMVNDVVVPTVPNGHYYYAARIIDTPRDGYSQWDDRGMSSNTEPEWQTTVGSFTEDRNLKWKAYSASSLAFLPERWEPNTIYTLGQAIIPTKGDNSIYYKAEALTHVEPTWPTKLGSSVLDNNIFWVCFDPTSFVVPLIWREYYILGRTVTMSNNRSGN